MCYKSRLSHPEGLLASQRPSLRRAYSHFHSYTEKLTTPTRRLLRLEKSAYPTNSVLLWRNFIRVQQEETMRVLYFFGVIPHEKRI